MVISQTASNLVLQANDGLGHFGLANPINLISLPSLGMLQSGNIALYTWPVGYPGFVLETSGRLAPATWVAVPDSPIQMGDQYLIPLNMTGDQWLLSPAVPWPVSRNHRELNYSVLHCTRSNRESAPGRSGTYAMACFIKLIKSA